MVEEEVIQRQEGVSLKLKMQRGNGTDDRDKLTGKVHGESIDELQESREELLDEMSEAMANARSIQPDQDDEE